MISLARILVPRSVFLLIVVFAVIQPASAVEPRVDDIMYSDPPIFAPKWYPSFSNDLRILWTKALSQPNAEIRRSATDSISTAVRLGMKGWEEVTGKLEELVKSDTDPVVRRSAARALVSIGAKEASATLSDYSAKQGLLAAQFVEPALAEWGDVAIRDVWLKRIDSPGIEPSLRLIAIEGLGAVNESRATDSLVSMVKDVDVSAELRLAAAKSVGRINASGLEELADALVAQSSAGKSHANPLSGLLAVALLRGHSNEPSIGILKQLASHSEPAVASAAIDRLHEIDLKLAQPFAEKCIASRDANLRETGAKIYVHQQDLAAIEKLAPMLNDPIPAVRQYVAASLTKFAENDSLKAAVIVQTVSVLGGEDWRGLEQASLVLGALDHEPAADRLIELLKHPRPEVAVASAWGLRKLQIKETLPTILAHATLATDTALSPQGARYHSLQLSQLFQLFGETRYKESETLLMRFVPKSMVALEARTAACWAIGYFHENEKNDQIAKMFAARVADVTDPVTEMMQVRHMSAVGIGRTKTDSQMAVLRQFAGSEGVGSTPGIACHWAIEQITGEKWEVAPPVFFNVGSWFLEADR